MGTGNMLRLAHLGILVSGVGYLAFFRALATMKASAASLLFFLKPALATGFSMMLASERPDAVFLAGVALVVISSAFGLEPPSKVEAQRPLV
jgi:drug/metabolite transporter (DMT)-like permease